MLVLASEYNVRNVKSPKGHFCNQGDGDFRFINILQLFFCFFFQFITLLYFFYTFLIHDPHPRLLPTTHEPRYLATLEENE